MIFRVTIKFILITSKETLKYESGSETMARNVCKSKGEREKKKPVKRPLHTKENSICPIYEEMTFAEMQGQFTP